MMIVDPGDASSSNVSEKHGCNNTAGTARTKVGLMCAHRRAVRGKPPWLLASCTAVSAYNLRPYESVHDAPRHCKLGTSVHG